MSESIPRKVQLTGRNTYILSLPHEWITSKGVKKGDLVYIEQTSEGSLVLSMTKGQRELKTCNIEVMPTMQESAMRNIVSAYVGGAGKIILKGRNTSTIAEEIRRILSGVEITDEGENEIILRIMAFEDVQIDGVLKRAFTITHSMFALAASAYGENAEVLVEIARKEDEVDRLYLLLLRTFCLGSHSSKESVFKAIVAKSMEKVSDHLEEICILGNEEMPNTQIATIIGLAARTYQLAYTAFANKELDRGEYASAKKKFEGEVAKTEQGLAKEKNLPKMLRIRTIIEHCNKVVRYSEDIMESSSDMFFATD